MTVTRDVIALIERNNMTLEHYIVGLTGAGYFIVGILQLLKGSVPNAMIWLGYSFAQVGLWINLK